MSLTEKSDDVLTLECQITNTSCCQNHKDFFFKKNTVPICVVEPHGCSHARKYNREDTEFYTCGCLGDNKLAYFFNISKKRESDIAYWTCECQGDHMCTSNTIKVGINHISKGQTTERITQVPEGYILAAVVVIFICSLIMVLAYSIRRKRNIKSQRDPSKQMRYSTFSLLDTPECSCGQCRNEMGIFSTFCCEQPEECLSISAWFKEKCLNKEYVDQLINDKDKLTPVELNIQRREEAYRRCVQVEYSTLAVSNPVSMVPACCRNKIQDKFPINFV